MRLKYEFDEVNGDGGVVFIENDSDDTLTTVCVVGVGGDVAQLDLDFDALREFATHCLKVADLIDPPKVEPVKPVYTVRNGVALP